MDLINIGDTPPPVNVFKEIDADKDLMLSREEVRGCGKWVLLKQVEGKLKWGEGLEDLRVLERVILKQILEKEDRKMQLVQDMVD